MPTTSRWGCLAGKARGLFVSPQPALTGQTQSALRQGAAALAHVLVTDNLEYAIGTNNAAVMLTLAKTVAMINQVETSKRRGRTTIESVPGAPKSLAMLRTESLDIVHERVASQKLELVRVIAG